MYFEKRIVNERFFDKDEKNIKKNCLPINIDKTYMNARIMCINGHYVTGFRQALESAGVRYGLLGTILGKLIFGSLGTIPGLILFLKSFYEWTVKPLIRQHNARDFILFPMVKNEDAENVEKVVKICNQLNEHPVLSINDGKVVKVVNNISNDGHYGTAEGNCIIIEHYDGEFFFIICTFVSR